MLRPCWGFGVVCGADPAVAPRGGVNHAINDTSKFWAAAESITGGLPAGLKVIHTFPAPDGRKAVCVWEGPSVEAVRGFLDPATAGMARNEYFEAPNKEGMAMPKLTRAAGA